MNGGPQELFVEVQMYRDMVKLGDSGTGCISVGPGSKNVIIPPAGGLQLNAATMLKLRLNNVLPFVDGWYTGVASFVIDAWYIGHWHQFQFCARAADTASVVNFEPSSMLIGYQPVTGIEQYVYSFSIRPTFPQDTDILTMVSQEPAVGESATDRYGRLCTRRAEGWTSRGMLPTPWPDVVGAYGPLLRAPADLPREEARFE